MLSSRPRTFPPPVRGAFRLRQGRTVQAFGCSVALLLLLTGCVFATAASGQTTAYVANAFDGTVSLIDLDVAPPAVITTFDTGALPLGVLVDLPRDRFYVTNFGDETVSVFDTSVVPPTELTEIPVGVSPAGVTVSSDGSTLFVANSGDPDLADGTVSIIDVATETVTTVSVGANPEGIAAHHDGTTLYVGEQEDGAGDTTSPIWVIDLTSGPPAVTGQVDIAPEVHGLSLSADGQRLYAASFGIGVIGTLTVLDTTVNPPSVVDAVTLASGAFGLAVEGERVWLTMDNGDVAIVDVSSVPGSVIDTVTVGGNPAGIDVGAGMAVIARADDDAVTILDTKAPGFPVITSVDVGDFPFSIGRFISAASVFSDGFESGNLSAWSAVSP
ncbi:MAG: hypothetical protein MPN21_12320 [Thermoanaerobaculia bacterium]|nr:hypothetical protein [Thermoanaerobaculia bacterium]